MCACLIPEHAVCLPNYKMKYEPLIDGIHLMCNFVVDCTKWQTSLDTHSDSISLYGNISLPFLECVLMIVSIFYLPLLRMVTFLKMTLKIQGCHHKFLTGGMDSYWGDGFRWIKTTYPQIPISPQILVILFCKYWKIWKLLTNIRKIFFKIVISWGGYPP